MDHLQKSDLYLAAPITNINSKWITDLNVKHKPIKLKNVKLGKET